ncbi:hypothetical protein ROS1_57260 [Roseibium sp. ROS1]
MKKFLLDFSGASPVTALRFMLLAALWFYVLCFMAYGKERNSRQCLSPLSFLTEDWPPYQYIENGILKGVTVDLLLAILKEANAEQTLAEIEVVPWARGYSRVKTQPNTVLFSMTRTPEREEMFKWAGPILKNDTYFIGRKDQGIRIAGPADLYQYRFGVIIDDASEMFAKRHGIPSENITKNSRADLNMRMLEAGRIDFVITGWTAFEVEARRAGANPSDYDRFFLADSSEVYFAFSKSTPDRVVTCFEAAFDSVKATGKFDHLFRPQQSYGPLN